MKLRNALQTNNNSDALLSLPTSYNNNGVF